MTLYILRQTGLRSLTIHTYCKNRSEHTANKYYKATEPVQAYRDDTLCTHTEKLEEVLERGVRRQSLLEQSHSGVMEVVEGSYAAQCECLDCPVILLNMYYTVKHSTTTTTTTLAVIAVNKSPSVILISLPTQTPLFTVPLPLECSRSSRVQTEPRLPPQTGRC